MKQCTCCLKYFYLEDFSHDKRTPDQKCSHCKSCHRIYSKKYREANREKCRNACMTNMRKNINSWLGFIPKESNCECCGHKVYFLSKNRVDSMNFDHRHGKISPIKIPVPWLWKHKFNEKNKSIWESCDFGILCGRCNMRLPTVNRKEFIDNVLKYIDHPVLHAKQGPTSIGLEGTV